MSGVQASDRIELESLSAPVINAWLCGGRNSPVTLHNVASSKELPELVYLNLSAARPLSRQGSPAQLARGTEIDDLIFNFETGSRHAGEKIENVGSVGDPKWSVKVLLHRVRTSGAVVGAVLARLSFYPRAFVVADGRHPAGPKPLLEWQIAQFWSARRLDWAPPTEGRNMFTAY